MHNNHFEHLFLLLIRYLENGSDMRGKSKQRRKKQRDKKNLKENE